MGESSNELLRGLLQASAWGALLAVLVGGVLAVAGRWIPPAWRALLWLLVLLRIACPWAPSSPTSVANLWRTPRAAPADTRADPRPADPTDAVAGSASDSPRRVVATNGGPQAATAGSWRASQWVTTLLVVGWGIGAVWSLALLAGAWLRLRHHLEVGTAATPAWVRRRAERCARLVSGRRWRVRVVLSDQAPAPVVTGWLRPTILLPPDAIAQRRRLRLILLHELRHVRAGDLWKLLLVRIVSALEWFHPVARIAGRCWLVETELACDAWVLRRLSAAGRREYGLALLEMAEAAERRAVQINPLAAGVFTGTPLLERRIMALRQPVRTRPLDFAPGALAVATLLLCGWTSAMTPDDPPAKPAPPPAAPAPAESLDILVAQHVLLWDGKIVEWDEVVRRLRARREREGRPIHPNFHFTNGAHEARRWDEIKAKIFEVYQELFEPAGVTLGSLAPRAGRRLDVVRTAADLAPRPERLRRGVVTWKGQPVANAVVLLIELDDPLSVAVRSDMTLRDKFDEVWTTTDEAGRFELEAPVAECSLAVLSPHGFLFTRAPTDTREVVLALEAPSRLRIPKEGSAEQQVSLKLHPQGMDARADGLTLYELNVGAGDVELLVPAGKITISRNFPQEDGGQISMPAETFELAPGARRDVPVSGASAADMLEAQRLQRLFRGR